MSKPMSHAKQPVTQANLDAFRERMEEYKRIIDGTQTTLGECLICESGVPFQPGTCITNCNKCIFGITPEGSSGCRVYAGYYDRADIRDFAGDPRAIAAARHRLKVLEEILDDYLSRWTFGW